MKMTGIEKSILWMIGGMLLLIVFSTYTCHKRIEKAGGIKQVVIDAGKDIKEISKEINK